MKTTITHLLLLITVWTWSLVPTHAQTADITLNGITYRLDAETQTAAVTKANSNADKVIIPATIEADGITRIGDAAFWRCYSLTSITLPKATKELGSQVFYYCAKLTEIRVDPENEYLKSVDGVLYTADGKQLLYYPYARTDSRYVIPEGTECIGIDAFAHTPSLKDVALPSSLKSIQEYAFTGCDLTEIIIPDGVTTLEKGVFYNCNKLQRIKWPEELTSIGERAFEFCKSLEHPVLPPHVTEIGSYAFKDCTNLKSITFPEELYSIGSQAFYRCRNLYSIVLPPYLEEIASGTFQECTNLTHIQLPEDLGRIGDEAFAGCTWIRNIHIPENVTEIGNRAFYQCAQLESIELSQYLWKLGTQVFIGCEALYDIYCHLATPMEGLRSDMWDGSTYQNCTLHVKPRHAQLYREAEVWRTFSNIVDDLTTDTDIPTADTDEYIRLTGNGLELGHAAWTVCTTDGRSVASGKECQVLHLPQGVYVVRCGKTTRKVCVE